MKGGEQMTDTKALIKCIKDSGLKQSFIAESLGLSPYGFARKRDNLSEFTATEIDTLCKLLHITSLKERFRIFFARDVE